MKPRPTTDLIPAEKTSRTYRLSFAKAPFEGILEAGFLSLGILIAIRVFEAGDYTKAAIAAASAVGLLFTPVTLHRASLGAIRTSTLVACYQYATAVCLLAAAWVPSLLGFAICMILAQAISTQPVPLMIDIYSRNYPPAERGRRVSNVIMLGGAIGALFSLAAGRILDLDLENYTWLLVFIAVGALAAGTLSARIPGDALEQGSSGNPWQNISLIWQDRLFGAMLGGWMLMGMAMLITVPLRVEYIANPAYGINATNEQVALITVFIPSILRILSTRVWGFLFDRINFITLRSMINLFLAAGVILYFNTTSLLWLGVGAALIGLGFGGGNIAWQLWVTKISPPRKVSAYMSVHAATTGLRGVFAPFIGYYLIQVGNPGWVGWAAGAMALLSIVLFNGLRDALNTRAGEQGNQL